MEVHNLGAPVRGGLRLRRRNIGGRRGRGPSRERLQIECAGRRRSRAAWDVSE